MHEEEDVALNAKAIALAVGGAALAGLLLVLARREDKPEPVAATEAAVEDVRKEAKKAAKSARKKRHELAAAASESGEHLAHTARDAADAAANQARAAERELKAAAWDAEQEAREAEHRLRAAGLRVAGDAAQLASRVGAEARNLAGEGRDRLAHLRHRDDSENAAEREIARLRAEIDELREQLGRDGKKSRKELTGFAARLSGRGHTVPEGMASEAAAAALAQLERSLKAKAPALLAAKNRSQMLEIIQQELGPTLKESAVQAATAALARWEAARDRAESELHDRTTEVKEEIRESAHKAREEALAAADAARARADEAAHAARVNGKHRFWHHRDEAEQLVAEASGDAHEKAAALTEAVESAEVAEEEHRGKAGLFWGGAGLGLALYALLDAERREQVLRLANEASIQVQELVRDLQGYDDEF